MRGFNFLRDILNNYSYELIQWLKSILFYLTSCRMFPAHRKKSDSFRIQKKRRKKMKRTFRDLRRENSNVVVNIDYIKKRKDGMELPAFR